MSAAKASCMSSSFDPIFDVAFERDQDARSALREAASRRILVLDGAMGTQIQDLGLNESHFRGNRFQSCECGLQGDNDLLTLTQPQAIEDIHFAYAMAGADILEASRSSMNSTAMAPVWRDGRRSRRKGLTASAVSSPVRWDPPTAPPRSRPTSTIRASAR